MRIEKNVPRLFIFGEDDVDGEGLEAIVTSLGEPFRRVINFNLVGGKGLLNRVFLDYRDAKELRDWLNKALGDV